MNLTINVTKMKLVFTKYILRNFSSNKQYKDVLSSIILDIPKFNFTREKLHGLKYCEQNKYINIVNINWLNYLY